MKKKHSESLLCPTGFLSHRPSVSSEQAVFVRLNGMELFISREEPITATPYALNQSQPNPGILKMKR
jgi:hypothetical protein